MAVKKSEQAEKPDLGTALKSSVVFTLTMIGEATFFMIRDWLDTTKSRPRKATERETELEESVALAALEQLESGKKSSAPLTEKQKMKHVKSMRQLMRATSVGAVVSGLRNFGRDEEAESLARRLVAIRKQMYGEEHMATAQALNQLGSVLVQQEDVEEALACFEESLGVLRAAFAHRRDAPASLHEAHLLHNIAACKLLIAQQSPSSSSSEELRAEAKELGRECVELCEKRLGGKHPKTLQYKRVWVPGFLEEFKAAQMAAQQQQQSDLEPPQGVKPVVDLVIQAAVSINNS